MGNEQSFTPVETMKPGSRRSLDATLLRQVNTGHLSPRVSIVGHSITPQSQTNHSSHNLLQSENRKLAHKLSDVGLPPNSNINLQHHRLSTDCASDLRHFKPKLSLTGREDMGNQQGRRLSRAAVHLENGGEAGASLVDSLKLSPYQMQLLQTTWTRIKGNSNTFAQVFKLLCFKSTICREMFQKMSIVEGFRSNQCCDLNMHAKVLADLLDSLMSDLTQSSKIVQARCMDIGASHVNMNERCCGSLWDQLGECLTEVITKVECVRSKREAVKAWISLLSYLVDGMKCGYMDEWKRKQNGRLCHSNGYDSQE
ncbi:unnamed protein product [Auanema sp. JU1783]|nr:unnamed protein product [Auanema sp. JU1783]